MNVKLKLTLVTAALAVACGISQVGCAADSPRTTAAAVVPAAAAAAHAHEIDAVEPARAIQLLKEGNRRFVDQHTTGERRDALRREQVAKGQRPFAIVLGCADSRVPPEVVFDQGLGDLFVIRVAGEVAPAEVIGSIEYAVEHLGCRTVVVLGHERCGAVEAALAAAREGHVPEGNLGELLKDITPATEKIDRNSPDALDAAVRANAKAVAQTIFARSDMLREMSHNGQLMITSARYDLGTGKVEFLDDASAESPGH